MRAPRFILIALLCLCAAALLPTQAAAVKVAGTGSECKLIGGSYSNPVTGMPCTPLVDAGADALITIESTYTPPACIDDPECGLPSPIRGQGLGAYADKDGVSSRRTGWPVHRRARKSTPRPEVKAVDDLTKCSQLGDLLAQAGKRLAAASGDPREAEELKAKHLKIQRELQEVCARAVGADPATRPKASEKPQDRNRAATKETYSDCPSLAKQLKPRDSLARVLREQLRGARIDNDSDRKKRIEKEQAENQAELERLVHDNYGLFGDCLESGELAGVIHPYP